MRIITSKDTEPTPTTRIETSKLSLKFPLLRYRVSIYVDADIKQALAGPTRQRAKTYLTPKAAVSFSVILSTIIGLLLVWDRGLYLDDYFFNWYSRDIITGQWKPSLTPCQPNFRILGTLLTQNLGAIILDHEFMVRTICAAVHIANAAMIGMIVQVTLSSSIAAAISVWGYLMPIWAGEQLAWYAPMGGHGIGTLLFLLALYLMLRTVKGGTNRPVTALLAICGVALGLHFSELAFPVVGLVPALSLPLIVWSKERRDRKRMLLMSVGLSSICVLVGLLHLKFFTAKALEQQQERGTIVTNVSMLFSNYRHYLGRAYWLTLSPSIGYPFTLQSFKLGLRVVLTSPLGMALLISLIVCCMIWLVKTPLPEKESGSLPIKSILLIIWGGIWMFACLLPGALLTDQILEQRMLYVSLAGLAFIISGAALGLIALFQKHSLILCRAILALPALLLILTTIAMTGICQAYKMRYKEDLKQISALQAAVPANDLAPDTTFIPIRPDFQLHSIPGTPATAFDKLLLGAFEISWAGQAALRIAYQRNDLDFIAINHWVPEGLHFDFISGVDDSQPILLIDSKKVPLNKALVFTWRNGRIELAESLLLTDVKGEVVKIIHLPAVDCLRRKGAITTSLKSAYRPLH